MIGAETPHDWDPETGESSDESNGSKPSQATRLVRLARERYTLHVSTEGEPFSLPRKGSRVARMLRGGRGSLRAELAAAYSTTTGSAPSSSALADALTVLEGMASECDPERLFLRVGRAGDDVVLDIGDGSGRAAVLNAEGWTVRDDSPVLFRRTSLTAPLPIPDRAGTLADLWAMLNVQQEYRPVLAAYLVCVLLLDVPQPVLALMGEQGTAKSSTAKFISALLDPSPAQLRKPPRDVESWTTAAAGSLVVALDNLSAVPDWLSDALCRAVTGDGDVRRRLYTDGDLHVVAFRRAVLVTGIDLGALNDDLADRLVTITLDRIPDDTRLTDKAVAAWWERVHPRALGAVLTLTSQVLAALPGVHLPTLPRMADFARVLAAVDRVLDTQGLKTYLGSRTTLAEDAVTSDPVLVAITTTVTRQFAGASADLLEAITPTGDKRLPKDWPSKPRALTTLLRRRSPSLRRVGWTVEEGKDDHTKVITWTLTPPTQREGANDARITRDTRESDVSAGQDTSELAGQSAGQSPPCGSTNPQAPTDPQTDPQPSGPVTSTNGAHAGDAGDAGAGYVLSLSGDHDDGLTRQDDPPRAEDAAVRRALRLVQDELGGHVIDPHDDPTPCDRCGEADTRIDSHGNRLCRDHGPALWAAS